MAAISAEIRTLTGLALPVVGVQVGQMLMGIVDAMMVGHLGREPLAAVTLGTVWVFGTFVAAMGILHGLDPIVSQAHGRGDSATAGVTLQRGVVLAIALSVPLSWLWLYAEPVFQLLRQDPELAATAQTYIRSQLFCVAPLLIFAALRQYLQGRAIMRAALWITLMANLVNLLGNWVLIFGNLGFPALGVLGAGIATGITRVFMMLALIAWTLYFRLHEGGWVPWSTSALQPAGLLRILRYGVPVGIQISLEVWAFNFATLLAGRLGSSELAAHAIVIKLASFTFMFPLGIGMACSTRVGNLIGAGKLQEAQRAGWIAVAMGAGVMLVAAVMFVLLRHSLPVMFIKDATVIGLASTVLPIAAAFQIFDGAQTVGAGVLRGMGDTRPAAIYTLLGFYFLALPLAWWLKTRGWGLPGIWWGLCLGLAILCALLMLRIQTRGPARQLSATSSRKPVTPAAGGTP